MPISGGLSGSGGSGPSNASGGSAPSSDPSAVGGSAGRANTSAAGASGAPPKMIVECKSDGTLPATAPPLQVGVWKNINPPGWPFDPDTGSSGIAVHPCNPAIIYLCTGSFDTNYGGLYRTTDAGATWARIGSVAKKQDDGPDHLDLPLHVSIDPNNPKRIYVVDGVRGGTLGFWVSNDGGDTFTMPDSFDQIGKTHGLFQYDVYDLAVDPSDFDHILLAFHGAWGWTDTKWNTQSGILESKDGGASWIVHEPPPNWGTGHSINFLFDPVKHVGDSNTWLLGTQNGGMFRTTNGGQTWVNVTKASIAHGGGNVYYAANGNVYASGWPSDLRSTDNGGSWAQVGNANGFNAILGDGVHLYTAPSSGGRFMTSLETDGLTWSEQATDTQNFSAGPNTMAFDAKNNILYTSSWGAGIWALKTR